MVRLDNLYNDLSASLERLSHHQKRLKCSRMIVDKALEQGDTHYDINTGFGVLAIELLTASQALDFRKPLRPGRGVEIAHEYVRSLVPHRDVDDSFIEDMEAMFNLVDSRDFTETVNRING